MLIESSIHLCNPLLARWEVHQLLARQTLAQEPSYRDHHADQ